MTEAKATQPQLPPRPDFPWEKMAEVAADALCDADIHGDEPPGQVTCYACVAIKGTRWALQMRGRLESLEAENESLKSELERARTQIAQGDGSCDHCGRVPAIVMPTSLCDDCIDGVKRAEKAEAERDRQYEFNTSQIAKQAELEAERDKMLEVIRGMRSQLDAALDIGFFNTTRSAELVAEADALLPKEKS